ncbi:MAG: hypothetical protein KZQ77_05545, partial [Candidatus Thiodiazotropha sp. (ex Notomyrtea botanica)]|nr:hypothetical protein [Candidatus Thiodiazotropha sp. (ex Notomyrtea botanica)]
MSDTPRYELYRLIDIVIAPSDCQWLPGNNAYVFSGHTLDELPSLTDWSKKDRRVFQSWLRQDIQVCEIEQVRRRLAEDQPLVAKEFPYSKRLYSALQRRIQALSLNRASPLQWRQTLLNLRRTGIRAEELEWSGLH